MKKLNEDIEISNKELSEWLKKNNFEFNKIIYCEALGYDKGEEEKKKLIVTVKK